MNQSNLEHEQLLKLKKHCYKQAEERFRGKAFFNIDRQTYIHVSKVGLDEWYSKSKSMEQIISICWLNKILEKAKYTHSAENKHKNDRSGAFFDYFECRVEYKEKEYAAIISVRNIPDRTIRKRIYYHHYLSDIKIESPSTLSRQSPEESDVVLLDDSCVPR